MTAEIAIQMFSWPSPPEPSITGGDSSVQFAPRQYPTHWLDVGHSQLEELAFCILLNIDSESACN